MSTNKNTTVVEGLRLQLSTKIDRSQHYRQLATSQIRYSSTLFLFCFTSISGKSISTAMQKQDRSQHCKSESILVVGAGPAGLTAAADLADKGYKTTVLESDKEYVGGISRTAKYKGYRFDIGGHRFFSKSSEVTEWWRKRLPDDFIKVNRLSRIYYNNKFFDYPLKASNALVNLGPINCFLCVLSYLRYRLLPIKPEKSFRDWVVNRFGFRLFNIFFKTYTEKVWGMKCEEISADWAAQRIKGLSLVKAALSALGIGKGKGDKVVKTLIDTFEYPRLGPGMMWEKTRDDLIEMGNPIHMDQTVRSIKVNGDKIESVTSVSSDGTESNWSADSYILSMPLRDTVAALKDETAELAAAKNAASKLRYRDFLTVALMVKGEGLFPDNWIYIHEPNVKLGRIQNFNNWSKELLPEENVTCLGLEYFCFEGDGLWSSDDSNLIELGKMELERLGLADPDKIFDGCVVRMPKAYPVYDDEYEQNVETIRKALSKYSNLQVVGRNGMHKYNNQDHSMMTAMLAAKNIQGEGFNLWKVNTDAEYHEEESNNESGRRIPTKA